LNALPTGIAQKFKTEPSFEGLKQAYAEIIVAGVVAVPGIEALVPEVVAV
jgi:hypothetical protein